MKMRSRWFALLTALMALIGASSTRIEARQVRSWPNWAIEGDPHIQATRAFQYLLRARSYKIAADGVFGRQTESALKNFQSAHGLDAHGIVDSTVWKKIVIQVRRGSRGEAVRAMQVLLRSKGYPVRVDGVFGAATDKIVRRYQRANGLIGDGVVGRDTWCELFDGDVKRVSEE
ncbi:MAG TPA: peptidoglycan-binding protein [Abditibacteriaceae bacterium]|nr:peptidoglycan-binding protein [Abditibacteriaceae bacterium]